MLSYLANQSRNWLIHLEKILASISLILLLSLSLTQLILRNFFELGFSEIDVISRHLVLFVIFMGAALAIESNSHIKIDCLSPSLSQSFKQKTLKPLLLISTIVCLVFFYYACLFWLDEFKHAPHNEQLALYLSLIIPFGFLTLSLHFFLLLTTIKKDPQFTADSQC